MAHFLGAQGSGKTAASMFPQEAKANRNIFYDKQGRSRTVEDLYNLLAGKVMQPTPMAEVLMAGA
jgi:hypothetical protein